MKANGSDCVKLVKGFYRALSRNDLSAARNALAPEILWMEPVVPGLWFSGTHSGVDDVFREIIEPAETTLNKPQLKMKKFFTVGDHVVAIGKFHGRSKATNLKLEAPLVHVWTLRNDKGVRVQAFHDILEWQATLGLTQIQSKMAA